MTADRTREILDDLEGVRENLLALSDDIWDSIEHNDPDGLEEGVAFKRAYNEKMIAFDRLATDLSALIQQFTSVRLGEEETGQGDEQRNQRLIRELDREESHSIDEDFTYKRPHGFVLDGQAAVGITTWRRLYELVCEQMLRRDPERFRRLPDNPDFVSNRGHHAFTRDPEALRSASLIGEEIHAEINLSANSLRDSIRHLLDEFHVATESLRIYLRQDRNAGRDDDAASE